MWFYYVLLIFMRPGDVFFWPWEPKQLSVHYIPHAKDVKGLWEQLDRDGSGAIGIEAVENSVEISTSIWIGRSQPTAGN